MNFDTWLANLTSHIITKQQESLPVPIGKHYTRLEMLADLLDGLPVDNFNMTVWHHTTPECGTVACAVGHAMFHKKFNKLGLKPVGTFAEDGHKRSIPSYNGELGTDAVCAFFGIDTHTFSILFTPFAYYTSAVKWSEDFYFKVRHQPAAVAAKIRDFVANYKGETALL